jgi:hypothetical protein
MGFLKNLILPQYYLNVLQGTQKFKVFTSILVLSILLTVYPTYLIFKHVYPVAKNIVERVTTFVNDVYPEELEVKIQNGQASTNVTEPYYITAKTETLVNLLSFREYDETTSSRIRLLAIDTKGSAEDFDRYQAMALLTESNFVYVNDGEVKINSLREVGDITVNKQWILGKINEYNKDNQIGKFINIGVWISPLFVLIGNLIAQIFFFVFISLLIFLIVKIKQVGSGFKNTFAYSGAVTFVVSFIWNLLVLVPRVGSYLVSVSTVLTVVILMLAYFGILKAVEAKKPGGTNVVNS